MISSCSNINSSCFHSLKVSLVYVAFSIFWILLSDKIVLFFVKDIATLTSLQTIKGWCFVVVSTGIIFTLLLREIKAHIAAEEKFQAIFDHHYQFTGLLNPDGVLVSANPAALELVGAKEEDVLGKTFWDTPWWSHSVDLQERIKKEFFRAATGVFVRFETTHPGADGEIHHIDFSINPVTNEDGEIIYLVPEGRDISPIKEVETALLESQALYKEAQEIAHIGHWRINLATKKLEWSDELYNIFEVDREKFSASYEIFINLVHPDDRDYVNNTYEESIKKKKEFKAVHRILLPDGRIKYILAQGRIEVDQDDIPLFSIGTAQDITRRREAEERLLFTQHTVDHSSTAIIWFGSNRTILYANEAVCDLLGYSIEDLIGGKEHILHPDGTTEYWDKFIPTLKENRTISDEVELLKKDGTILTVLTTGNYMEYMDQEKFVFHFYDLTRVKKAEEELRQAQKMEAIGTLAGGIAHDFNNILSAIFGYLELAEMETESKEKRSRDLNEVKKAALRAKDLVTQILTFGRKKEHQKQPLQASLIVKETLKLLRPSIPATIEFRQGRLSDSNILADPTQLHQVMMNLCTNAYHAMRETGGTLGVELKDREVTPQSIRYSGDFEIKPGKYVVLEISDTGLGMDEETKSKIFDPYYTTKGKGEGTGLGLAVVHGIVKDYGGCIHVDSKPGQGTTFHLYFPIAEGAKAEATIAPGDEQTDTNGTERIILVDDEMAILDMASEFLSEKGYKISCYSNALQALQEFKKQPDQHDLIVTDMTMPKMTGTELAQEILGIRPDIPIILCTGHSELVDKKQALSMGIKKYCEKPVTLNQMAWNIRDILDQGKTEAAKNLTFSWPLSCKK